MYGTPARATFMLYVTAGVSRLHRG